jgi:acetylglutamate kinase
VRDGDIVPFNPVSLILPEENRRVSIKLILVHGGEPKKNGHIRATSRNRRKHKGGLDGETNTSARPRR